MRYVAVLLLVIIAVGFVGCTTTELTTTTMVTTTTTTVQPTATTSTTTVTTIPAPAQQPQLVNDTLFSYRADIWNIDYGLWKNDTTGTQHVIGQSMVSGQVAYCIKNVPDTDSPELYSLMYYAVDGYQLIREEYYNGPQVQWSVDYDPQITFDFPLQHGSTGNYTSTAVRNDNDGEQQLTVNYTITVEYAGPIATPMGTYDCYLVIQVFTDTYYTFMQYYSPDIGYFVASKVYIGNFLIEYTRITLAY